MAFSVMFETLSMGFLKTLGIFIWTLVLSMPFGLVVYAGRTSKNVVIRNITKFYISVMRGTPLMLQLLVWYFAPYYLWGANIGSWLYPSLVLGFMFNYAAYFAEIYRSGFLAIPAGQYEAARLLGYSKMQTTMKIILPQVVRIVLPSVTNEIITLVKDTSLVFVVAYAEMFTLAKQIAAAQTTLLPFVIAGVYYYVFCLVVSFVMEKIEKKMNYYQ